MDNSDLAACVDLSAYQNDASYHFAVDLLDAWMTQLKAVLERHGVPEPGKNAVVADMLAAITGSREGVERQRRDMEAATRELTSGAPIFWRVDGKNTEAVARLREELFTPSKPMPPDES